MVCVSLAWSATISIMGIRMLLHHRAVFNKYMDNYETIIVWAHNVQQLQNTRKVDSIAFIPKGQ